MPIGKQAKSRKKLSDEMKKKTIVFITKAAYISYQTPTPTYQSYWCACCVYA